jgi:hypothetical protein
LGFDEFRRMAPKLLNLQPVAIPIDREVLALDKTKPPEFIKERDLVRRVARGGE